MSWQDCARNRSYGGAYWRPHRHENGRFARLVIHLASDGSDSQTACRTDGDAKQDIPAPMRFALSLDAGDLRTWDHYLPAVAAQRYCYLCMSCETAPVKLHLRIDYLDFLTDAQLL